MSTYTLTLIDTASIQPYIFGSNVLRENIGASELVWRATRIWPFETAMSLGATNIIDKVSEDGYELDDRLHIDNPEHSLVAEVIYAGGGQCAILFTGLETAKKFTNKLSRTVLAEAPELKLVVSHIDVDLVADILAEKERDAAQLLQEKKLSGPTSKPLLGLGATVDCSSTGFPAVGLEDSGPLDLPTRSLSAGVLAKLSVVNDANRRLRDYLPHFYAVGLTIPYEFDKFGREAGSTSYIAVVHADGNGMGQRIETLQGHYMQPEQYRDYILARRNFSRAVSKASKAAISNLSALLLRHRIPGQEIIVCKTANGKQLGKTITLFEDEEGIYIPFRPLVFGGDDLTFITDGRLGLTLAAAYLDLYEAAINEQDNEDLAGLQACAGVAVVKTHYPFSRAYDLADNLCANAKREWRRECAALDWHFAATGIFGDISTIRQRQYTVSEGQLEMRPVPIPDNIDVWRSWGNFSQVTEKFLSDDKWRERHNKVIALREALRQGSTAVEQFRQAYKLSALPVITATVPALQNTGWDGSGRCGYFDSIEALDFFIPLQA